MTHRSDTKAIEADIAQDRAALASAIDKLQDRVSVEHLAQQAIGLLKTNVADYTRSIDRTVRSNPAALALVGAGLAWLIFGRRPGPRDASVDWPIDRWEDEGGNVMTNPADDPDWSERMDDLQDDAARRLDGIEGRIRRGKRAVRRAVGDTLEAAGDVAKQRAAVAADLAAAMKTTFAHGLEGLSEQARDRVVAARQKAYAASLRCREIARNASAETGRVVEDHPFAVGLAAFAAGAALASALPRTETEDRAFGAERDRLMDEARRVLAEERDRAARVATGVAEELADSAKATVEAVGEKLTETGSAIRDRARAEAQKDPARAGSEKV